MPEEVSPVSVEERRKETLLEVIVLPELPEAEKGKLQRFLEKHHSHFVWNVENEVRPTV